MTLASLKAAVAASSPAPWAASSSYPKAADIIAIVALRNKAAALIRCAELLREARSVLPDELIPLDRCRADDIADQLAHRIDAALAEVEGK